MRQPFLAGALLFNTKQNQACQWNEHPHDPPFGCLDCHSCIQIDQKKQIISFFLFYMR